jgi:pre-mRNA-splicing factor RBM22/SLT11
MASIKRDDVKQKWEETEFPLVCETCLGDNPYVRMTKQEHAKKCKICEAPFTVFAWQAGTKGRLKKVEICRSCAQAKNVCQVCIYDLQYGLPVKVRDKILREAGSGSGSGSVGGSAVAAAVPQSVANRSWFTAQQERALAQGLDLVGAADPIAHAQLQEMANMEPRYERNLPKLCSFFARGECNRGADCPFRHEMPRDRNDPLSKQNTKDRFYGTNDPVAGKLSARMKRLEEEGKDEEKAQDGYDRARATVYVRLQGDGPFPTLTEGDVRDQFYSFGEIVAVRVIADRAQAFVEYTQPEAAELAIATLNRKVLQGHVMNVSWARAPKRGNAPERRGEVADAAADKLTTVIPAAPPGALSSSSAKLPAGLVAVRPPPEVAAIAAARRNQAASSSSLSTVPRPGGGVIRGVGAAAARRETGSSKPYYPSADPSRLGSRTSPST